jgi:hypothetical protein
MDGRTDAGSADQRTADGADGAARGCQASTQKAPGGKKLKNSLPSWVVLKHD